MALPMKPGQVRFDSYGQTDAQRGIYLLWFKREEEEILAAIPHSDIHDKIGPRSRNGKIVR